MKRQIFKAFRTVHAWGGGTLALLMLLVSVTGALLVWKQDYLRWTIPQSREEAITTPAAMSALLQQVAVRFDMNRVYLVELPREGFALAKVTTSDGEYAYLDQRGDVVARWQGNERWEEWLFDLHHRLLLENTGLKVVGYAALAMIVLVLAGLVAFWPMRRGFELRLWPQQPGVRYLRSVHRNLGLLLALPLLMSLTTGAILAFPEQSQKWLLEPFRDDTYSLDFAEHLDGISGGNSGDWLPALQRALDSFPGAHLRGVQPPNEASPYRIIWLQQTGEWNPVGLSKVYIDARGGYMDIRIDSQAQLPSERLYQAGYPLHTGKVGGWMYKLALSASGWLVALLSMLGLVGFVRSWRREIN